VTDFPALVKQFIAALGKHLCFRPELQSAQLAIHMTDAVNAVQHFLPDVTPLLVTDGARLDATLAGQIRFVHVRAEARNTGLDAQNFERVPAAGTAADGFCRGNQLVRHRPQPAEWHEQVKAAEAQARADAPGKFLRA
jgi:hypothetical protein